MIELQGKYAQARVFTDVVDPESISQVISLLNQPYAQGSRVRMMPDIHAGAGCTVGTTMTIGDKICPNLVGVDIGCGMETVILKEKRMELQKLDKLIRAEIPSGFAIRSKPHRFAKEIDLEELRCAKHVDLLRAEKSIGTLGGGNHFIEANQDEEGNLYIVIHSGSRRLGLEIANYYQDAGFKALNDRRAEIDSIIADLKRQGRAQEIEAVLRDLKARPVNIPRPLAYLEGNLLQDYLHDMAIAQHFADLNRKAMMDTILKGMGLKAADRFTTIHNYIDLQHGILRKGAVSAQEGERLLIPINMRDGSLICIGKGNEDWNCSAPHGAGRLMSRSEAKQSFTVSEFKKQMQGIYTTSVGAATLDECPMAYKSMADIVDNIGPTADIERVIKPIYNFKADNADN
ncbi:MAG: RtcB family protein [Ruminococcaceae bacterium]|nr:RtcB family protein [Oscillospiraceae bacterium]